MNVMAMFGEIGETIATTKGIAELSAYAARLEEAYNAMVDLTMTLAQLGKSSGFLIPILNASSYLDIFGDLLLGHFLLQSAAIAQAKLKAIYMEKGAEESRGKQRGLVHDNADVAFYAGKIAAAKFFAVEVLCTVKARCEAIKSEEKIPIEMADESFTC
jgi:hypothetical protein